jgi:hypothetical protein
MPRNARRIASIRNCSLEFSGCSFFFGLFPLRFGFFRQSFPERPALQPQKRSSFGMLKVAGFVSIPFRHKRISPHVFLLIIRFFHR